MNSYAQKKSPVLAVLEPVASLKLTVALFVFAMALIFTGTLAQVEAGLWEVLDKYFRSWFVWVPLRLFVPDVLAASLGFSEAGVPGALVLPGGYLVGGGLMINLLAAHLVRFKMTWKRSGIVVLHAGIAVLLLGEMVTGLLAVEGHLSLDEGESRNYIEDIREVELAVIDRSDPKVDRVVAVPQSMLRAKDGPVVIRHEKLPFEVRVDQWMANSDLFGPATAPRGTTPWATEGFGAKIVAQPAPVVSGVEGGAINAPSACITLLDRGQELGRWLVSWYIDRPQSVRVGDKAYDLQLRFKRMYRPYWVRLIDFRHDRFVGTQVARNFSSLIHLTDPSRGEDRQVLIAMNEPLRYAGETFYQSSFNGETNSVLQVVKNPGWLLPYFGCTLVAVGMVMHFFLGLMKFLGRVGKAARPAFGVTPGARHLEPAARGSASTPGEPAASALHEESNLSAQTGNPVAFLRALLVPAAGTLVCLWLILSMRGGGPAPEGAYDLRLLGRVPVSADGRVKPWDTVARTSLQIISGKQSFRGNGESLPAIRWLADVIARPEEADQYEVFRIDHPEVLALLGLSHADGKRFSFARVMEGKETILQEAEKASHVKSQERNAYQKHVMKLANQLSLYTSLRMLRTPYVVPPLGDQPADQWLPMGALAPRPGSEEPMHPGVAATGTMFYAYGHDNPELFAQVATGYRVMLDGYLPGGTRRIDFEVFFNRYEPFYKASIIYVGAFLLACGSFLLGGPRRGGWAGVLNRTAVALLVVALAVHTFGLGARVYLQGRPPVTNLYSSAVFIGWACVGLALLIERVYRLGLGSLVAAVVGFVTLVIAHNLALTGDRDTLEMMQAVLDTNFWLATHVVVITIGYAATFLAGLIAVFFIFTGVATRALDRERHRVLGDMIYGVVCFATVMSFIGTVLGGIWADQSWGRFWGWDPKENGAVLIVLMNALILHARWAGLIRQRGMAVLAVGGNIVTAWSWFGTNMLGVGLHSYGFMDSAVLWLLLFVVSQLVVMGLGVLPMGLWRSFAAGGSASARTATGRGGPGLAGVGPLREAL